MRSHFDDQLNKLNEEMIHMGILIEQSIERASALLVSRDAEEARLLAGSDDPVDRKQREIETLCLRLILMQQPVARDLRLISSALKMITDMERIGDQASDIAEIMTIPIKGPRFEFPRQMQAMGQAAGLMVRQAVDAFVQRDVDMANQVIQSDDAVDALFYETKEELLRVMRKHTEYGMQLLDALMVAKYLERIADHAVNIAEWVEYAVSGVYKGERLQ